jgi:hypothetical protein
VVLGSLNDARKGGQDASIKQSVANIRSQAELYYNQEGYTYTGVCDDDRIIDLLTAALEVVNGDAYVSGDEFDDLGNSTTSAAARVAGCTDADVTYIAAAPLASNGGAYWCVDGTGASMEITSVPAAEPTTEDGFKCESY